MKIEDFGLPNDERSLIIADAESSVGRSPEERMAIFKSIIEMVTATWATLSEEEQLRRLRLGEKLDSSPEPWWRHVRPEGLY